MFDVCKSKCMKKRCRYKKLSLFDCTIFIFIIELDENSDIKNIMLIFLLKYDLIIIGGLS